MFDFPASPVIGQIFNPTPGVFYTWSGSTWERSGGGVFIGDSPPVNPIFGQVWWKSNSGALYIYFNDGNSSQWVQILAGGGGGGGGSGLDLNAASGTTLDTGQQYRLVMMSNGTVVAIPYDALPPATPVFSPPVVRYTSVVLNWAVALRATSYILFRDGVQIATTPELTFRDTNVTVGATYAYTIASVDTYRQRSPSSAPVTAFIDPALNNVPINAVIKCWPIPIPTDGWAYIRVNGSELDCQLLSFILNVDAGSITPTADPSVWAFRI